MVLWLPLAHKHDDQTTTATATTAASQTSSPASPAVDRIKSPAASRRVNETSAGENSNVNTGHGTVQLLRATSPKLGQQQQQQQQQQASSSGSPVCSSVSSWWSWAVLQWTQLITVMLPALSTALGSATSWLTSSTAPSSPALPPASTTPPATPAAAPAGSLMGMVAAEREELKQCRALVAKLYDIRKSRENPSARKEAIICLVGATSAGKSALIKALVRIPYDDDSTVTVSRKAHTTLFPSMHKVEDDVDSVLHFCDLPGTHGVMPSGATTPQFLEDLKSMVNDCCAHADIVLYCFSHNAVLDYMRDDIREMAAARPPENTVPVLTKSDIHLRGYSAKKNDELLLKMQRDLNSPVKVFSTSVLGYDPEDEANYGNVRQEGVVELREYLLRRLNEMRLLPPSFIERLRSGEYNNSIMWTTVSLTGAAAATALVATNPVAASSALAVLTNYVAAPTAAGLGAVLTATTIIASTLFRASTRR